MPTKFELALIIQNNKIWHISKKIAALKYISETELLSDKEMSVLETYFKDENTPPRPTTNLLTLSLRYLFAPYAEKCTSNLFVVKITGDKPVGEVSLIETAEKIVYATTAASVPILILIHDALLNDTGEVIWYDPISTMMSVRWSDGGYTVRSFDTTKRMFSLAKRIGEIDNADNSRKENMQSL